MLHNVCRVLRLIYYVVGFMHIYQLRVNPVYNIFLAVYGTFPEVPEVMCFPQIPNHNLYYVDIRNIFSCNIKRIYF